MSDEKKVVNLAVEPPPQIDRTPPVAEPPVEAQPSTEPPVVEPPVATEPPIAAPPAYEAVDEFGVPYKNRYMEQKRKNEEVIERLPQLIEEKLSKVTQQPQTPQYTYEQLEAYKLQNPTDPQIVSWCTQEQRKMQQAEQRKMFEEVVGTRDNATKAEIIREKSLIQVQNEYPEAFLHDANGQPTNWDLNAPITQQIFGLMKNPKIANESNGLIIAAEIAYGRVAKGKIPVITKQVAQGKADLKQAQKASLTEGGGKRVTLSEPVQTTAINTLKKTGSIKDAETAIGAILRQKGILVGE